MNISVNLCPDTVIKMSSSLVIHAVIQIQILGLIEGVSSMSFFGGEDDLNSRSKCRPQSCCNAKNMMAVEEMLINLN